MIVHNYFGDQAPADAPSRFFSLAAQKMGMECLNLEPKGNPTNHGKCSFRVEIDWGAEKNERPAWIPPQPSLLWAYDIYRSPEALYQMQNRAKHYSIAFCASKFGTYEFLRLGANSQYLPACAEPTLWKPQDTKVEWDLCFIDDPLEYPERVEFFDKLFKAVPSFHLGNPALPFYAPEACAKGLINLMMWRGDWLPPRLFETMCGGNFVLCPAAGDIEGAFKDGEHLATFKTVDEAIDKARFYLDHPEKREAVAREGRQKVLLNHTYIHRINFMLHQVGVLTGLSDEDIAEMNLMMPK